ncbi:hypothetical protein [Bradyrhizobium sp.]|uniref:hypothetical protein n=1 Tax=Bradyrhizobium sp. TaxID=376 RepID=UPI0025C4BBE1|nr:hypothetical protein [Bradyrhizobium sp.]
MPRHNRVSDLAADSLASGSPAIGQPAFGQLQRLSAVGLEPPLFGRTPEEIGFEKRLIEIISGSPDRRTKSKQELVELGRTEFGLSERRAMALRESVIMRLRAKAWCNAGAPKGRQSRRTG